jgi:polyisoprenoid-binding protein YceI
VTTATTPATARILATLVALLAALDAGAAERTLALDPAETKVAFTLGATLHTVRGTLRLTEGALRFDEATGAANGEIVLDATSAETGNGSRDRAMHQDVLESETYREIRFRAERLEVAARTEAFAEVTLHGTLAIHGGEHPLAVPATLRADGERLHVAAAFRVPYVAWGLRDPSTLLLRVDPFVDVKVEATAPLPAP